MTRRKVIIVGGGLSALAAAWRLADADVDVTLLSPTDPVMWPAVPSGGLSHGTDRDQLADDSMHCGRHAAVPARVRAMTAAASGIVESLLRIGVPFTAGESSPLLRRLPGMSNADAVFVGENTELAIATAIDRLLFGRFEERVSLIEPVDLRGFIVVEGQCRGVVAKHRMTHEAHGLKADAVIVAGGSPERLLGARTPFAWTESVLALALDSGAVLANMHRCQQQPAAMITARGVVVPSPSLRAEGARLWTTSDPNDQRSPDAIPHRERLRFLDETYPAWGECVPDDLAAMTMRRVLTERGDSTPLYLDISHLPEAHLRARFAHELDAVRLVTGCNMIREPLPVEPRPLGWLGGLWIDHELADDGSLAASKRNHQTAVAGLYAVGGVASAYHGGCALGGNAPLADLHGAQIAAEAVLLHLDASTAPSVDKAVERRVTAERKAHAKRVEAGYGASHRELEATLSEAVRDLVGPRIYDVAETVEEVRDVGSALAAGAPEARAGDAGADQLLALQHMHRIATVVAQTVWDTDGERPLSRGALARAHKDVIEVAERLDVDGHTIEATTDEVTRRDYEAVS